MDVDPSRLRVGELLAGASAIVLLVLMFAVNWYGSATVGGGVGAVNGWDGLVHVRWLVVVTIAAALLLVVLQATCRAPALPVTMSVIVTWLALATVVWLGYRVLISVPAEQKAVAYIGWVCCLGILAGGYLSTRQEGISAADAPRDIPTVGAGERGGT